MTLRRQTFASPNVIPLRPGIGPSMQAFQIADVFLSRSALESVRPEAVVRCNREVVNRLLESHLEPTEIHQDAMRSWAVDYYARLVASGGHQKVAADTSGQFLTLRYVREGLAAMGALVQGDLFDLFETLLSSGEPRFDRVERRGTRGGSAPLGVLDERFRAVDRKQPLAALNGRWLASRDAVRLVEDADLPGVLASLTKRHPDLERRSVAWLDKAHGRFGLDPHTEMAIRLCDLADREWRGWTARVPGRIETMTGHWVDTIAWSGRTREGACLLYFVEGRAWLIDADTHDVLATLPLQA